MMETTSPTPWALIITLIAISIVYAVFVSPGNGLNHDKQKVSKSSDSLKFSEPQSSEASLSSKPKNPPKPVCVRFSGLPGDATEDEFQSWLDTLELSKKATGDQSRGSGSTNASRNRIQCNLVLDGGKNQATATFIKIPAIFEKAHEDIRIQNDDNPRWNNSVVDTNFLGITVIYAPPTGTNIRADIVAVSGLGGHALGSWGSPMHDIVWLRDFLPKDLQDIRVLLWGYNTNIRPGSNENWKERYSTLARSMLHGLRDIRDEKAKNRPIIFLGHSLGGIIVEQALITAHSNQKSDELYDIFQSNAGVFLFGVPHDGLRFWELVTAVAGSRNEAFINDLVTDSDTEPSAYLKMHIENFRQVLESKELPVICYYEKDHSKISKIFLKDGDSELARLLVTERSATGVGIRLNPLETLGLKGDHRSIVKFKTMNDEGYKSVQSNINRMITKHEVVRRQTWSNEEEKSHTQIALDTLAPLKNLEALNFQEMKYREQEIQDAYIETCRWVLEHSSYKKWIENDNGILGIRGKPGSGKSTLLKMIFKTLKKDEYQTHIHLAFFYHRRGTVIQYSQVGMYRTLLYELLSKVPLAGGAFKKVAEEKEMWQGSEWRNWEWRLDELQGALTDSLLVASKTQKIKIFIDALDEAGDEAAQDIIRYFRQLNKKLLSEQAYVSMCISCRHFPILVIKEGFEVRVEEHNQEDISKYVYSELEELIDFDKRLEEKDEVLDSLASKIIKRASNIFMWVAIVVRLVAKGWNNGQSVSQIEKKLSAVPSDLDDLYRHILINLIDRTQLSETLHLMQWIFLTEQPLSPIDLHFALASDNPCSILDSISKSSKESVKIDAQMKQRIISISGGLVEVKVHSISEQMSSPSSDDEDSEPDEEDIVQFIHQSVKDFLGKDKFKCLQVDASRNLTGLGHDRLARSCMNFLKHNQTQWSMLTEKQLKNAAFCKYSVTYCFTHASKAEVRGMLQTDLITRFEYPSSKIMESWVDLYRKLSGLVLVINSSERPVNGSTLLHMASWWNLNSVVQELLRLGVDVEEADQQGNVALHYSAYKGCETVTNTLLAAKASPNPRNKNDKSPLTVAASSGQESIIRLLLGLGLDINSSNALHEAATFNQGPVIRWFLRMGADVNAQGGHYGNALQAAVIYSSETLAKLLLDAGADINAQGGHYGNALQAAAIRNSETLAKLLLDAGADVNAQGGQYDNALQAAAMHSSETLAKLLLDAGADVNAQGGQNDNALQAAAIRNSEILVKLLLDAGADVNAQGGRYGNALQAAASYGSEISVKLLLDAGADVNAQGGRYGNALQAARKTVPKSNIVAENFPEAWIEAAKKSDTIVRLLLNAGAVDIDPVIE